jgi:tRNA threonylcarbamoyladenosine biosynthesis protein TsaB
MKILAIDTSIGSGSVAAVDETGGAEMPLGAAGEHARSLPGALRDVAERRGWGRHGSALAGLGPDDVVAVVRGPGSFTGLRVGVTAAKALAWTTGARLVGVCGFEVVARRTGRVAGWNDAPLAIAFDAGRGEVSAAWASPAADAASGWTIGPPTLVTAAAWIGALPPGSRITGPALETLAACAEEHGMAIAPRHAWLPAAIDAAAIAGLRAGSGDVDDPRTLVPDYLRPSYAEERQPRPQ